MSVRLIFWIPSVNILFFDIALLKAREDNILSFEAESLPFKSEIGLASAKPSFFALWSIPNYILAIKVIYLWINLF